MCLQYSYRLISRVSVRYIVRLKQFIPLISTLLKYLTSRKLLVSKSRSKNKGAFFCLSSLPSEREGQKQEVSSNISITDWQNQKIATLCVLSAHISPSQPGFRPYSSSLSTTLARTSSWPPWSSAIFVFLQRSPVRSRVCGVATLESILQTAGVWSRVLRESSSVCVFGGLHC